MRSLLFVFVLFGSVASATAATFQPTRFDDPAPDGCLPGDCSLREAVIAAGDTAGADTIVLGAGDYQLQLLCSTDTPECSDLDIVSSMSIQGAGPGMTFISNKMAPYQDVLLSFQTRLLDVQSVVFQLSSLTVREGVGLSTLFGDVPGGCLRAQSADLKLSDVVFSDCHSTMAGGAVYLYSTQAVFERVVWATGAPAAARALAPVAPDWARTAAAVEHTAITTVYAWAPAARLVAPMLALRDGPAQFAFDRGTLSPREPGLQGVLALVISHSSGEREDLQAAALAQARAQLGVQLLPLQTVTEKRATFACRPGLQRAPAAVAPGLWAAGDHVDGPYPATLEGAVRSGLQAVRRALDEVIR